MQRNGRGKRSGPYRGGMGTSRPTIRTTVSYNFESKELIPLLKKDKAFFDAAMSGKYVYLDGRIALKTSELLHIYDGKRIDISKIDHPSKLFVGKLYKLIFIKRRAFRKVTCVQHEKTRVEVLSGNYGVDTSGTSCDRAEDVGEKSSPYSMVSFQKTSTSKLYAGIKLPDYLGLVGGPDDWVLTHYLNKEDPSFSVSLKKYMEDKKMTNERLAESAGVSSKTIQRLRNDPEYRPSLKIIVAICLSLHLYPGESYRLIDLAGYRLTYSYEEKVYRMLIEILYTRDIEEINEFMTFLGVANFKQKYKK